MKVICTNCGKRIDFVEGVDRSPLYADLRMVRGSFLDTWHTHGYHCSPECVAQSFRMLLAVVTNNATSKAEATIGE